MDNFNPEMARELSMDELVNVNGGALNPGDRAKMLDGSVCSKCGHAIGTLTYGGGPVRPYGYLVCEKCENIIGIVLNSSFVVEL